MKVLVVLAAVAVILCAVASYADTAQNPELIKTWQDAARKSLSNLSSINVGPAFVCKDLEDAGLTSDLVTARAELRLRNNGVPLMSKEESEKVKEARKNLSSPVDRKKALSPMLIITVSGRAILLPEKAYAYTFNIQVRVLQCVEVLRLPGVICLIATWESGREGFAGTERIAAIYDYLNECLDLFSNDFLAANPKKAGKEPSK